MRGNSERGRIGPRVRSYAWRELKRGRAWMPEQTGEHVFHPEKLGAGNL